MHPSCQNSRNNSLSERKGGRTIRANLLILTCSVLFLFASIGLSEELGSIKGKVTSIDSIARTIIIGDQVIQAPKTEFGVVPISLGGTYSLLDSGRPAEVKVGDEVKIKYVKTKDGKRVLTSMTNYSRPGTKPAQKDKEFSLLESSLKGEREAVDALLQKGISPNAKDKVGISALMFAAWGGNIEVVKTLIAKGANVNAKDDDGQTALLFAAVKGHLSVVKFLVENNADVDPGDYKGAVTSNESAQSKDLRVQAEKIFKSMNASPKDKAALTPLMCAKKEGHDEVVKYLVSRGAKDADISGLVVTIPFMIVPKK